MAKEPCSITPEAIRCLSRVPHVLPLYSPNTLRRTLLRSTVLGRLSLDGSRYEIRERTDGSIVLVRIGSEPVAYLFTPEQLAWLKAAVEIEKQEICQE